MLFKAAVSAHIGQKTARKHMRSHEFNDRLTRAWRNAQQNMPDIRCVLTMRNCVVFIVFEVGGMSVRMSDDYPRGDNDN